MKKLTSLLIALLLVFSLAVPAFAAESLVDYYGHGLFDFDPGSTYTPTDLFDEFKNVMPGDKLEETVTVTNTARCCDYIKIYLQAVPHNRLNPLSPSVDAEESIASMENFLAQLTLTVTQDGEPVYSGPASDMDRMNRFYLGKLKRGDETTLDLQLTVPLWMDNGYAFREGEIDWEFTIEEYDYDSDNPKTGDHMQQYLLPAVLVMSISAAALAILLIARRRKDKKK